MREKINSYLHTTTAPQRRSPAKQSQNTTAQNDVKRNKAKGMFGIRPNCLSNATESARKFSQRNAAWNLISTTCHFLVLESIRKTDWHVFFPKVHNNTAVWQHCSPKKWH
jgi:hypothetical protein